MSAADDLGLTPRARADYLKRLQFLFAEGCAIFGSARAAQLFREQARSVQKKKTSGRRSAPPQKRKGSHDPEGDRLLVQSWKTYGSKSKTAWARMASKNHAVKIRGKVRNQSSGDIRSLVRRLNRLLKSETNRDAI